MREEIEAKDPRLLALLEDQQALEELLSTRGWRVTEELIRQVQTQAASVLKSADSGPQLYRAQGVLSAFEQMWSLVEELKSASEDQLDAMVKETRDG